jgi:predicted branched-subunit amino acid permease
MNPAFPSNMLSPAPRFRDGFVAVAPLVPGVAAFALVCGGKAAGSSFSG